MMAILLSSQTLMAASDRPDVEYEGIPLVELADLYMLTRNFENAKWISDPDVYMYVGEMVDLDTDTVEQVIMEFSKTGSCRLLSIYTSTRQVLTHYEDVDQLMKELVYTWHLWNDPEAEASSLG